MPYREQGDPNAGAKESNAKALEKMEKEIAAEGKFSIRLPEDMKVYDPIPLFEDAINNNIDYKDIVFYSLATGILKYRSQEEFHSPKTKSFYYRNPDNPAVELDVYINKNNTEDPHPQVFSLTTKAKVAHDKKINKEMKDKKE